MFSSKNKFDVKKSTQKFLDLKKDIPTRYKHLKCILENVDGGDLKNFFEQHASHIMFIFTENFAVLESNIRQKGARAVREEFECDFHLFENILVFLPEMLHRRWHYHTIYRTFLKLLHRENNVNLRREATRLFLIWYQILGDESTDQVHAIFATLVPGFASPYPGLGLCSMAMLKGPTLGPTGDSDLLPLSPPVQGDAVPDDLPRFFLEVLLRLMVDQLTRIHWHEKASQMKKSFNFLFEAFKKFYVDLLFPQFRHNASIYKPSFEMHQGRRLGPKDPLESCRVEVIKWVSRFTHVPVPDAGGHLGSSMTSSCPSELTRTSQAVSFTSSDNESTENSSRSRTSSCFDQGTEEIRIVQEILFGSRVNVNFIHEVFRHAFLLSFSHSIAIRRVIDVYKDWITKKVDVPPFALEPVDLSNNRSDSRSSMSSDASRSIEVTDGDVSRMRPHSNSVNLQLNMVRAGLQNVLQTFVTNSSNVFLLDLGRDCPRGLLEEQFDICKQVLNIHRHMVLSVKMDQRTWEQLLAVLLHITSQVLSRGKAGPREQDALQDRLAKDVFHTLVVTWIRANLNVCISGNLWDQFIKVASSLTEWEELIREWTQTTDQMTKILARHLYGLELNDLPLDRMTEQKAKKRRGGLGETCRSPRGSPHKDSQPPGSISRCSVVASTNGTSVGKVDLPTVVRRRRVKKCLLRRTCSDGCINSVQKEECEENRRMTDRLVDASDDDEYVYGRQFHTQAYSLVEGRSLTRWQSCESYLRHKKVDDTGNERDSEMRCSSPTPSSGVESTSTPMPIDGLQINLDSQSMDTIDRVANENRSVMLGGVMRGWTPDSAALLWRRILCFLGDVNEIANTETHAKVFDHLCQIAATLVKIRANQGVSLDNLSTPPPPEFIPPLHIFVPWCFKAFELPDSHSAGKLYALRLLCKIFVRQWDIPVRQEYLIAFYQCLHRGLTSNVQEKIDVIFRWCLPRFLSLQFDAYTLLIGDFVHAAEYVVSSSEVRKMPRRESVSLLGSLLFFPDVYPNLSVLEPNPTEFRLVRFVDFRESLISLLLTAGKREPTPLGRCISVSSLAIFIYKQLEAKQFHPKMKEAVLILLSALRFRVKTVAQIACDMLYLISEHATILVKLAPELACRIIEEVAGTFIGMLIEVDNNMADEDKRLLLSLELCFAEWCMRLPSDLLLQPWPGPHSTSLLDTVLKVLKVAQSSKKPTSLPVIPDLLEDFENDAKGEDLTGSHSSTLTPTHSRLTASLTRGDRRNRNQENIATVRMGAQFVMDHLLNQLGHFPLGSDAARHTSMVSEIDDLPSTDSPGLVFDSPNVQIFVYNRTKLISFVELPILLGPGGGVPAGLQTDKTEVRVIIRDLNGKHCWDTAILHNDSEVTEIRTADQSVESNGSAQRMSCGSDDQTFAMSSSMISGKLLALPHHTVRHRPVGELPSWNNTEPDMDNLHDVLSYLKHTSPEVCGDEDLTCPKPPPACITSDMEDEAITLLLSQKTQELDFVSKFATDITMTSQPCEEPETVNTHMPFQMCRMLLSQFGLLSWENRNNIQLLKKNEQLIRELKNLDNQKCRETHKIAVIYVAQGQEDKVSILSNNAGSPEFEDFVARLGWEVELESHKGFMGGLQRNGSTGETAPYYATSLLEVIYHVSTRMPSDSQEGLLQKTRHLGNDEVHIVWSEHIREYRRGIIPTEFCDVLIIIYPLKNGLFRIQVSKKPEIPFIGPLFNECIVDRSCLPGLVRATALNASRAKRSLLPLYQTFFEERYYALESLVDRFAMPSSYEEFCSQVLVPSSTCHFQPAPTRVPSGSLLSTQQQCLEPSSLTSLQSSMEYPPKTNSHTEEFRRVSDVSAPEIDESPKPSKRLSFKQASRFVSGFGLLPDVSPVIDQKKFPK